MNIEEFIKQNRTKLNNLEELFLRNILVPDYGEKILDYITVQFPLEKEDGSIWKYDFLLSSPSGNKYILETDGLYAHAEKVLKTEYFDQLQEKQNHAINEGYRLFRFTNNSVRNNQSSTIYALRRFLIGDETFHNMYLKRYGELSPSYVQSQALNALKKTRESGKDKAIVILATGLGKTYLSAFDVDSLGSKKVLFLVHIKEILRKSKKSFEEVLSSRVRDIGSLRNWPEQNIIFATIQTMSRNSRLASFKPDAFDYIIMDETHHIAAKTYKKIFSHFKPSFFLGLTATPDRTDGDDVLLHYDNNVPYRMDQQEAIEKGYLVPIKYLGFKDDIDYRGIRFNGFKYNVNDLNKLLLVDKRDSAILDKFMTMAKDKKTLGFCVSIEHAEYCKDLFNKNGIRAVAIHSGLKDSEAAINNFRKGGSQVAFVVDMFNEGVDIPEVECLLLLRPTSSKLIFTQQLGRGLRIASNKHELLVLDFIGNYKTSNKILDGLGFPSGVSDIDNHFERRLVNGKPIFFYNNMGYEVSFDEEVIDIFKASEGTYLSGDISEQWISYGEFLEDMSKKSNYWKCSNQNSNLAIHLYALDLLDKNVNISDDEFSEEINRIVAEDFDESQTMRGARSLFFSKLIGFLGKKKPFDIKESFKEIRDISNSYKSDFAKYDNIITRQLEKLLFWNDIYSKTNRYKPDNKITSDDFRIYPLFFIYDILLRLKAYGIDKITREEFRLFVIIAREHQEIEGVVSRIVNFQNYPKKIELSRYLEERISDMDDRFFPILNYSKYIILDKNNDISLSSDLLSELSERVEAFRLLLENNKLVTFKEGDSDEYFEMLYSNKDLLEYRTCPKE